jgi:arginine N-succinyltransferase
MFFIRPATIDDLSTLLKLAKMVHFINLPADRDIIAAKISRSRRSFAGQAEDPREREFMFVLEDLDSENVVGTAAVRSCVSWPGHPHCFFQVRKRKHWSDDLQTGIEHVTVQLQADESGPSEVGGLILAPGYRGHAEKLGSLLSLIRFHFIGLHKEWFSPRLIAEMMGALAPDSGNLLWEYLGRRFINLSYTEADRFNQHSKEFMTSLFPKTEIYASLLPPEARNLIGKVGEETRPAKAMLEKLGFKHEGHVDPFDGGPYLVAQRDEISLVRNTSTMTLGDPAERHDLQGFVSFESDMGYRALRTAYSVHGDVIAIPPEAAGAIGAHAGDLIGVTPTGKTSSPAAEPKRASTGRTAGGRKVAATTRRRS